MVDVIDSVREKPRSWTRAVVYDCDGQNRLGRYPVREKGSCYITCINGEPTAVVPNEANNRTGSFKLPSFLEGIAPRLVAGTYYGTAGIQNHDTPRRVKPSIW